MLTNQLDVYCCAYGPGAPSPTGLGAGTVAALGRLCVRSSASQDRRSLRVEAGPGAKGGIIRAQRLLPLPVRPGRGMQSTAPRPTRHHTAELDALKDKPTGCVQWAVLDA